MHPDTAYTGSKPHIGELKTKAANRHIPIPTLLRNMPVKVRGMPDQFVFLTEKCEFCDKTTFEQIRLSLTEDAGMDAMVAMKIVGHTDSGPPPGRI